MTIRWQPSCQFWCFWEFLFLTYGPTRIRRTTWPCDLDLWTWRSWRCRWYRSSCSTYVASLNFVGLPVSALIGLVTLTFDSLTSKYCHRLNVWWASILPILGFRGLFVFELVEARNRQTDGHRPSFYAPESWRGILHWPSRIKYRGCATLFTVICAYEI